MVDELNALAQHIHEWARSKGFYDREYVVCRDPVLGDVEGRIPNPSLPSEKLLLVVSEITEAQSALRDGAPEQEAEEVADAIIRLLDYCAWRGIDPVLWVHRKMAINEGRPYLHGRREF